MMFSKPAEVLNQTATWVKQEKQISEGHNVFLEVR